MSSVTLNLCYAEINLLGLLLGLGVLSKLLGAMPQVLSRLPSVLAGRIALPLDVILDSSLLLVETGIDDFLHDVLGIRLTRRTASACSSRCRLTGRAASTCSGR